MPNLDGNRDEQKPHPTLGTSVRGDRTTCGARLWAVCGLPSGHEGFHGALAPSGVAHEEAAFAELVFHGDIKSAAYCLRLGERTVKGRLTDLYARIGATGRLEAATKLGWLNGPGCGRVK